MKAPGNSNDPAIALVGMYGGMRREYNPGCFWTGYKTYREMRARFPHSPIDAYSIDNQMKGEHMPQENPCGLLPIRFFSREKQMEVLENILPQYDAVIMGGDIIWGGDDSVEDNPIFFAQSPVFLASEDPSLLFNCVHTFYDDEQILEIQKTFYRACERANYISVRTQAIRERLKRIGIPQNIHFVPDIVLDCDLSPFRQSCPRPKSPKPTLGISVRASHAQDLAHLLERADLRDFDVSLFPFSRQYDNLKTVQHIKDTFHDRYRYIETYGDPVESFLEIGNFDTVLIDTLHGITAAVLQNTSFVSLDVEQEQTSRKDQQLDVLGIGKERNIRLNNRDGSSLVDMTDEIQDLLKRSCTVAPERRIAIRNIIQTHFDTMAHIIRTQCK